MKIVIIAMMVIILMALPPEDEVKDAPGFINQTIYSGYLSTNVPNRQIHYVFVKVDQKQDNQKIPLTIWFNGGPGCSSLIGMLQQIGPYLVGNTYKLNDSLIRNDYAWNRDSNLLFLESPAFVGFSSDTNHQFHYTDPQTAQDAFAAIKDFLLNKGKQYIGRRLYLAGESYAGKYIPDVTDLIINNNRQKQAQYINLKGIMVGNGVMSFENDQLTKSSMQYLGEHQFLSQRIHQIYNEACGSNFNAPRCRYARYEYTTLRGGLDPYNVFQVCRAIRSTQSIKLLNSLSKQKLMSWKRLGQQNDLGEINECPNDQGITAYWNTNKVAYKVDKVNKTWSPCSNINYQMTPKGSMDQYYRIFLNNGVKVWLFNGDWDDVVPFTDTQKNLPKLNKHIGNNWQSWFVSDKHAGFYSEIGSLSVITVKAAGHMVPQNKPKQIYQLFYNFINDRPINSTVPR